MCWVLGDIQIWSQVLLLCNLQMQNVPNDFAMVAPCVWKRSDMFARIMHVIVSRSRPEIQIWAVA